MNNEMHDWIIVGGGAAGISIAEMLSRLGLKVLLVEKNEKLASETTRIFHEWLHSGSLYTLVPDRLATTRYLLGAIDDLFEYYSGFESMNLCGTQSGYVVKSVGWFNDEHIYYKYRSRPFNPLWNIAVARAKWLIGEIGNHDWLRKRAGSVHDGFRFDMAEVCSKYPLKLTGYTTVRSPDVTMNSRRLLTDLINSFEFSEGNILVNCDVHKINDLGHHVRIDSNLGSFSARHVAICCADGLSKFTNADFNISYAPMFVVDGVTEDQKSFVELDYYSKSCINLIKKGNGFGLAGGISIAKKEQIMSYYNYCVDLHKKRNPNIKVLDMYVGLKKELANKGHKRNYLYHINSVSPNVWGVALGKFTLMFSLAPEFIRRAYGINPPRVQGCKVASEYVQHSLLSNTHWQDIIKLREI